jgi:acetyl esterase/lipase
VENLRKAGVEASVDVYHTDMHAFDMLRDDDVSREAIKKFKQQFETVLKRLNEM